MNHQISFATKNDFLHACVILALFAVSAAGLFDELTQHESDVVVTSTVRR